MTQLSRAACWIEKNQLPLVLGIAAFLRLFALGVVPGGLNQDEASTGYDAWALLHAGVDRNGFSWPVQFLSWGSGQNALYAWLSMPFLAFGGLHIFWLRLAMALAGIAAIALFWRLGNIAPAWRGGERRAGMCAALILTLNPWHIMASRWALESNILPFVVLAGVACLAAPSQERRWLLLGSALLGMSVYAYGPAYLFAPVFFLGALVLLRARFSVRDRLLAVGVIGVVALPMLVFVVNNRFGTRSLAFGPISLPHYPGRARFDTIFLPFSQAGRAKLGANAFLCLRLVFGSADDGLWWNSLPGFGPLLPISLPFLGWGLLGVRKEPRHLVDRLMLLWFVTALAVALMTDANINRINLVWVPAIWFVARGLLGLAELPLLFRGAIALFVGFGVAFSVVYFGTANDRGAEAFSPGFGPALHASLGRAGPDDRIVVTNHMNMSYISTLFFSETPVLDYLHTVVIPDKTAAFQSPSSFTRFIIGVRPDRLPENRFYVVHRSEKALFDPKLYGSETYGNFCSLWRR